VAAAATRLRLATPGVRRLLPSALEWAAEGLSSFEAAYAAARGGGGGAAAITPAAAAALLEVPLSASRADVRAAYRRLAATMHPDVAAAGLGEEAAAAAALKFASVREAYDLLTQREATGARADSLTRAAVGYAAWAAGKRDWEALQPGEQAQGGGVPVACRLAARALEEQATLFFATRNRAMAQRKG